MNHSYNKCHKILVNMAIEILIQTFHGSSLPMGIGGNDLLDKSLPVKILFSDFKWPTPLWSYNMELSFWRQFIPQDIYHSVIKTVKWKEH